MVFGALSCRSLHLTIHSIDGDIACCGWDGVGIVVLFYSAAQAHLCQVACVHERIQVASQETGTYGPKSKLATSVIWEQIANGVAYISSGSHIIQRACTIKCHIGNGDIACGIVKHGGYVSVTIAYHGAVAVELKYT